MDSEKVEANKNWPSPKNVFEVRSFHGLASFYRKFIQNFSGISTPMMDTAKKRQIFSLDKGSKEKFQSVEEEDHGATNSGVAGF
jgi:hypothetical protein